ncbi:AbrB family transcriptional regulator (stage V sporulation protein T) [Orenia metallireducens]|jgi:AbrB family transcriptional regulator (stage V sporulation protein T)|uniref:AbrB family transcriptional regulator, stage V sporulation protein T n=1 Tax=Orenia metallireducens TaxID=1413210 RepID=A0A285F275_9FIRM|nr:stage V sporulation T C-terminal domain-containing protein [Orenia metallireducens]PRX34735.1 AbrB family transcriptional regulator (stage V sporulation protein T) [Orenia metallireducens]SNY05410.1 AbrB family transcriptional regulator, stage V sporulation protein T [Orenia metallireducens]
MRATGIVRKIDNLGRVVIPKEIRTEMKIDNGNTLEIYVDQNDTVILKKYSPVRELSNLEGYIDTLLETTGCNVMISDTDKIIDTSSDLQEYNERLVGNKVKEAMKSRKTINLDNAQDEDLCANFRSKEDKLGSVLISPIIKQGDILGAVILSSQDKNLGDFEAKASEVTAKVISKKLGL